MGELTQLFTDVANSIRKKDKTTQQIPARQFPERIDNLTVLEENQTIQGGEVYDVVDIEEETRDELSIREVCAVPPNSVIADVDSEGNVFCFEKNSDGYYIALKKISRDGAVIWESRLGQDMKMHLASDGKSVYVARGGTTSHSTHVMYKLNENGETVWSVLSIPESGYSFRFAGINEGYLYIGIENSYAEGIVRFDETTGEKLGEYNVYYNLQELHITKNGNMFVGSCNISSFSRTYLSKIKNDFTQIWRNEKTSYTGWFVDYRERFFASDGDGNVVEANKDSGDITKLYKIGNKDEKRLYPDYSFPYISGTGGSIEYFSKNIEDGRIKTVPYNTMMDNTDYKHGRIGNKVTLIKEKAGSNGAPAEYKMYRCDTISPKEEAITEEMYNVIRSGGKCTDGNYYGLSKEKLFMIDITITDTRKTATLQKIHGGGGTLTE